MTPNHLSTSTSPYLLQHAHNPVEWYPWGSQALEKARQQDKPIFLSIGYAACHWCHVMAHESFEDPTAAALMNQHFINIKVDREQRPDIDGIYMAAVQALTGQGGWPLSVFLTPDLQPFYGGTYYPPTPRHALPAFKDLLQAIADAWNNRRQEVLRSGNAITQHLQQMLAHQQPADPFTPTHLEQAANTLVSSYDWRYGGWGLAPKFPQPMAIEFLLRRHHAGDPQALESALHALQCMARGGMYDVVGGGFARYSTDNHWLVPHFEKMLYDNAQLAQVYLHTWQIDPQPLFQEVVEQTLAFVTRELLDEQGGFYSSLDADSEGQEGKFYVWTQAEIRPALDGVDQLFESAYNITPQGNWEGKMVLQRALDDNSLSAQFNLTPAEVRLRLADMHNRLLAARSSRIRPATDDKVLTSWNALMLAAFAEAARVFNNPQYLLVAQNNARFLLSALRPANRLRRAWRQGQAGEEVFLEDYAALILGLLELYQSDFDTRWFAEALSLAQDMIEQFSDPLSGFFDTPTGAEIVLTRPKDLQDNAIPSGNALAAEALFKLAALQENPHWLERAAAMFALVAELAPRHPTAFSRWLSASQFNFSAIRQVALLGERTDPRTQAFLQELRQPYRPDTLVAASSLPLPPGAPALLHNRPLLNNQPTAYVCTNFTCLQPTTHLEQFRAQLEANTIL